MKRNFLVLIGLMVFGTLFFAQSSFAAATVALHTQQGTKADCTAVGGVDAAAGASVNREGIAEEGADVVFQSTVGAADFAVGTYTVTLTGGIDLTSPFLTSGGTLSSGNVVVCDGGAPTLAIAAPVVTRLISGGGLTVQITFNVGTTNAVVGARVVLKNLRWNVSPLKGDGTGTLTFTATVPGGVTETAPVSNVLATAADTVVAGGAVTTTGAGVQSSGAKLGTQALLSFTETSNGLFRKAAAANGTTGDIATTGSTVGFNVTGIPTGVTVTFPSTLTNSAAATDLVFGSPSATTATGGSLNAVYQVTTPSAAGPDVFNIPTGGSTGSAGVDTVVVTIGSTSAFGTASIQVVFGPQDTNVVGTAPSAIPSYVASNTASVPGTAGASSAGTGVIVGAKGAPVSFFSIAAVQSNIIIPWAGDTGGFETGIAVANTGVDQFGSGGASLASGQSGVITFTFFPTAGSTTALTPFSFTTSGTTIGTTATSLGSTGLLAPGQTLAITLTQLLAAAGQPAAAKFQGTVMIQTQFQFAHASVFWFTSTGSVFNAPAFALQTPSRPATGIEAEEPF